MIVAGINAYHGDSSACLAIDGRIVAAAEEERFRRVKHWAGLPTQALAWCLSDAGLHPGDVEHVAINTDPRVNNFRRLGYVLTRRPQWRLISSRLRKLGKSATIESALQQAFPGDAWNPRVHHVEHHLAHLASGFLASRFDEAVNVSIDGFGDFASAAWGLGRGQEMHIDGRVYFPHSLGIFYSAITQWLGFPHYGDEYKVMGLAPYGRPEFMSQMRQIVHIQSDGTYRLDLRFFRHHRENVAYTWNDCSPEVGDLFSAELESLLGPRRAADQSLEQRHKDVARSAQAMYEEACFALLNSLYPKYNCPNLTLSGGCAMNSVANGKICLHTPFRRLYLPAAAGDAGGAIGAALVVSNKLAAGTGTATRAPLDHAYLGPAASDDEIARLLQSRGGEIRDAGCTVAPYENLQDLCQHTAQAISDGLVVGWFQGRMEWGPRALGNRSILGDPRRADMKDILNLKIKRRESFRPFAPSILRECVAEWFEQDDDVPFMMQVFQVRPEKRALVPATTHVDGSGRLHTVDRQANPLFHELITEFHKLTSVPMVLNTSFNENEPVVCRPEEALDCFLRTQMDLLVLNSTMITRCATDNVNGSLATLRPDDALASQNA